MNENENVMPQIDTKDSTKKTNNEDENPLLKQLSCYVKESFILLKHSKFCA